MLSESEQDVVSGMIDILDDLMTGVAPAEVMADYQRLRAQGMRLTS